MNKSEILIPCEQHESDGGYTSHDGQSLAYVKREERYVFTKSELIQILDECFTYGSNVNEIIHRFIDGTICTPPKINFETYLKSENIERDER